MRILIVKMSALGDIVQTFAILPALQALDSSVTIDWVVERPFASLVQAHPLIHQVICVDTQKWRRQLFTSQTWKQGKACYKELQRQTYDLVLDLQGNIKSGLVTACVRSKQKIGFGLQTVAEWPNVLFTHKRFNPPKQRSIYEDYLYFIEQLAPSKAIITKGDLLRLLANEKELLIQIAEKLDQHSCVNILVCPGSAWKNKRLPLQTWKLFLTALCKQESMHMHLIWGNANEKEFVTQLCEALPLGSATVMPALSLPVLQHVIAKADLAIAMDSLALHLAATTATPTYSLFGPSSAKKYQPLGKQHGSLQGICPYKQKFEKRCPYLRTCATGACMHNMQAEELLLAFQAWWSSFRSNTLN